MMTTAGIPPSNPLLSKSSEVSSNREYSTTGLRRIFGIALQKVYSLLIPPEPQAHTADNNKKTLIVPDISVDFNINTPIFEAVQGKAKLIIPNDETESIPFEGCNFVQNPVTQCQDTTMNCSNRYDMAKTTKRQNAVHDGTPPSMNSRNSSISPKKSSNWTPLHLYNKSKTCGKNRKEKNRHNLQINIMEDICQNMDDHYQDSDNEYCSPTPSPRCSILFSSSNLKSSLLDLSEQSFPSISSSNPMIGNKCSDLPGPSSPECDSEESFVMLFDMTTTSSVVPSVSARINRQRCRQISECSDDSIVFCYDSDDNDLNSQAEIDFDGEDDSEEEETDDSSDEDSEGTLSHQPDSGFEEKKVQFILKPEVHVIRAWDFAYRQARKGEWEMAARDRERFKKRIQETGNVLSSVFDQNLRDRVYNERFSG